MLVSQIVDNIQATLQDDGVYATDAFVLDVVNDGHKLASVLTWFDERRGTVSVSGARNMVYMPTVSSAEMLGPAYVANTSTGNRVSPVRLEEFELYASGWEGQVDGADVQYYTMLSPYHSAEAQLWCVPISTSGSTELTVIGPCVPVDLTATDTPRLPEQYQDMLYYYGLFGVYVAEPGRGEDATQAYGMFVERTNQLIEQLKSRFPSWQGFRPSPVEYKYTTVMRYQQKQAAQTKSEEGERDEG
jgi:hypothetical protein